jgi:tetratricopeptide (TPR) repeat protein
MNCRLASVVAVFCWGVCPLWADSPSTAKTDEAGDLYALKTPYHTEEEWIVGSICRNAFEILSFIADKKGEIVSPDHVLVKKIEGNDVAYEVTLHGAKVTVDATLHWPGSIWSSQAYVPFCLAAMNQLKLSPAAADQTAKGNPLATLLDFSAITIEAENRRVSQWLAEEPDNTLAQQQAALVLGMLAMKENSGWFWNPRDACNHVAAHLAVARSLDPGADLSVEGQLAECMVGLISDNKKDCADEMDSMEKMTGAPKELNSWLRAGRMRNSRDWRIVEKPEEASAFEQVEYFRALSEAVDVDQGIAWMQAKSIPMRQDWIRIVMESPFSVEAGHAFATSSVATEITAMRAIFPDRFSKDTLISDLNENPEDVLVADASGHLSLQVISNGMWAEYFQRHLCHAIVETGDFLQNKWGVPDDADQFNQQIIAAFSGLKLFPYVQEVNDILCKRPDDPGAIIAAFGQHPESALDFLGKMPDAGVDGAKFQAMVQSWFSPALPSGTAYDVYRLDAASSNTKRDPGVIDKLYAIAPLQFRVAELELTTRYSDHPTYAQVQEIMGPLLDYFMSAQKWAIKASDLKPDQRFALEQKAAALDPGEYLDLARDYASAGRDSDAANAYQQWYDHETDRVWVSNEMGWLVSYYYDHGQKDKAMAIAKEGAEVYSYDGLLTMMKLLARMGELDQAEDYGQKIKERYNDSGPLIVFYHQQELLNATGPYKAKFDDAILSVFPLGLKSVTVSSFSGPPTAGMQFSQTSDAMTQNGLSSDQVVVALDGYQVQSMAQYSMVRAMSDSPSMTFVVWDGHAYREIKANQPGRRFGVDMVDYPH